MRLADAEATIEVDARATLRPRRAGTGAVTRVEKARSAATAAACDGSAGSGTYDSKLTPVKCGGGTNSSTSPSTDSAG